MENLTNDLESKQNKSNKSTVIAGIILLLLAIGLVYSIVNKPKPGPLAEVPSSENLLEEELTNLTAEDRSRLEGKVVEYQQQIKDLSKDSSPEDKLDAYLGLAATYNQLGKYGLAIKELDKIAADYQESAKLWSVYAAIYQNMKDYNKSVEAIKAAVKLDESNPRYWFSYFQIDTKLSTEERINLYEEALVKTDNNINIIKSYAEFLVSIDNKEAAIAQWEQAKQLDPEYSADYQAEIDKLK